MRDQDITLNGHGSQSRSFCYADDLLEGLRRLMAADDAGPINLGNPHEITVHELAHHVIDLANSRSRIAFRPLPQDDPSRRRPDIGRARAILGWQPRPPCTRVCHASSPIFDRRLADRRLLGQAA